MKNLLFFLLLVISPFTATSAVVKSALVRLNKNEIPAWSEYHFQMKRDGLKYAILSLDTVTDNYSFIWNGQRVCTDKRIHIYDLDLDNIKNCVYVYGAINNRYLIMDGQKLGPFEKVYTQTRYPKVRDNDFPVYGEYGGYRYTNTHYFLKKEYSYSKDGIWYTVYDDGIVGKANEIKRIFYSPSRGHKATLSEDCRILSIDNSTYILPLNVDVTIEPNKWGAPVVCLFDDGTCYIEYKYYEEGKGSLDHTKTYCLYVTPEEIIKLKDNEYFDLDDKRIYSISQVKQRYLNQYSNEIGLNEHLTETDPFNRYCPFWKGATERNGYPNSIYTLTDNSGKHILSFRYDLPEIYIDGQSVYKGYVLDIYYDDKTNSFCWLTFYNQTIWINSYKLT